MVRGRARKGHKERVEKRTVGMGRSGRKGSEGKVSEERWREDEPTAMTYGDMGCRSTGNVGTKGKAGRETGKRRGRGKEDSLKG